MSFNYLKWCKNALRIPIGPEMPSQVGGRSVVNKDITQLVEVRPESDRFPQLHELLVNGAKKDQTDRESTIFNFKNNTCNLLIATSIAIRGLDVKELEQVINYEDYGHRVGRTGRAGSKGCAITFISEDDARYAPDLVKALQLSEQVVPDDLKASCQVYLVLAYQYVPPGNVPESGQRKLYLFIEGPMEQSVMRAKASQVYTSALKLVRSMSNMGAKNHGVVIPDSNIDFTINALVAAGVGTAGQRCMALSTVFFVRNLEKLLECAKVLKVSAGTEPDADLGPVISKQLDLNPDGEATDPWRLCTVDQVEELKLMVPVKGRKKRLWKKRSHELVEALRERFPTNKILIYSRLIRY
ncbi:DEAD-box ATP-dependent RNA helicase 42 [Capsicum baccatum]|uniref:methylmalonate-semialdehyde dehydrogenase (CoA acylating) n=1 Tax=Capsicum baccatum TaxID=33114 RepID=A0A2G2VHZ3_CAPBA|nr:DEAD-box ATP-dependent RNA helicase 42 [Capsicum baccatum]